MLFKRIPIQYSNNSAFIDNFIDEMQVLFDTVLIERIVNIDER